ncbi:MAG: PaaI family thioesterase [Chloroflexi bacterium]|nr:PaaI family thioesterase [Chloroflexota bacterium]
MNPKRIAELLSLFNNKLPIAQTFGMILTFTDDKNAIIDLPYNPKLDHGLGNIHGGVYATMLESAGWFTSAAAHEISCWVATSEISLHFLEHTQQTSLHAVGKLIKSGKRQDIAEMRLYDETNNLIAQATGTFIILPNVPMPEISTRGT